MEFCMDHWTALRTALDKRGLTALIPDSSEKAMSNLKRELSGEERSIDTFDPLMNAHWAIVGNLMDNFGIVVMGPGCPLCHANDSHDTSCLDPKCIKTKPYDDYIERAADDQIEQWKVLNE